jgi:hypothetical protein
MPRFLNCFFATILAIILSERALSSTSMNLELGQATSVYNKVKINGEDGTLFNLTPALNSTFYYRLSLIKKFNSPHGLRLLYAPLKFSGDKRYSENINFNGVNFPTGKTTEAEYKFNSYRGTYFYELVSDKNFLLRLGGTLKIRDASIELKQDDRKKIKKNTGLVPLLYLYSQYKWDNDFLVTLDFDGLMAPQGRAFDVALMGGYQFSPCTSLQFGGRILDGGADNEKVYNFSQINYYFTSLQVDF